MVKRAPVQAGEELTLMIEDLSSRGSGVGKIDRYPLFIENALVGEEVRVRVSHAGQKYGRAEVLEHLTTSPDRVELTDPLGQIIGTMSLQHLSYSAQLAYKTEVVRQAFQRIGHFEEVEVRPSLGMDHPWQYRNKAQIPVRNLKGQLETGFYQRGTHDLVAVENFHIQYPQIDQSILKVRDLLRKYGLKPYDEERHQGDIRHLIIRQSHKTNEQMIILVTQSEVLSHVEDLIADIRQAIPQMVSLIQNVQSKKTNVIMSPHSKVLWGQDYYADEMLGLTFHISANSFFQVNTPQAERLYQEAIQAANLKGDEVVLDAYCGIGSISLALAQKAGQVYAMEIVPQAIEMAHKNAALNQLDNVHFQVGSAEEVLPKWQAEGIDFEVMVVDPPRKGLDRNFIQTAIELGPERFVYVSCNPATCARDCRLLAEAGYELKYVQPVDLFPQTTHVECVTLMSRIEE